MRSALWSRPMTRPVVAMVLAVVLGSPVATAHAQPTARAPAPVRPTAPGKPGLAAPPAAPPAALPAVGDALGLAGTGWPKLDWLYDLPSPSDSAGKVVVHWFCAPKVQACIDDLARIVTLKENGRVYVVAYINGSKGQAKKLDPIRESEGVGRGTVAFGRGVAKLVKELGITAPASIVVDVDGKVLLVSAAGGPAELDARDAKVSAAVAAIKEYVSTPDGPKVVKSGDKFPLSITITLASWLTYSNKTPMELKVTVPPDIKCDATTLKSEQMKVADKVLSATVNCSGPRGIYEARGELRF